MGKKILVVIDCQNDFITGSLRNEEAIKKVPNIVKKITDNEWDEIIVTQDTHNEDYLETREGKNLPVVHCVKYTDGWKINEDIDKAIKDAKFNRNIKISESIYNRICFALANYENPGQDNDYTEENKGEMLYLDVCEIVNEIAESEE